MENNKNGNSFSSSLGFVLAAAGSAVGLGNIWRFPYLAARNNGGLFLLVYIILVATFGFSLLVAEVAIGRMTKRSPVSAYGALREKWKPLGFLTLIIPIIVLPYYCAVGGWVLKFFLVFLTGNGAAAAQDGYFTSFISDVSSPIVLMLFFMVITVGVTLNGVQKGIEKFSKIVMPLLIILIIAIAIFSITIRNRDSSGEVRTGIQGLKVFFVPNFKGLTFREFYVMVLEAVGQIFFSLSVATGVMIAYGSYMRDDSDLPKSIFQIEVFDTLVAILAGVMIITSVYVFMGYEGMEKSGPELMFVLLPKVFKAMGPVGNVVGCLFFAMVFFAAATSSVSLLEAIASGFIDKFSMDRKKAVACAALLCGLLGLLVCLGYNKLYFEIKLPNDDDAQVLDVMDYISNNILMPLVAFATCLLVGWVIGPEDFAAEITKNGESFPRKKIFVFVIKFVAPISLIVLFVKAAGIL